MKAKTFLILLTLISELIFALASVKIISSSIIQPETNTTLNLNFVDSNGYNYNCNLSDNDILKQQFNVSPNSNNYTYTTYYYIKEVGEHNVSVKCVYNLIDVSDAKQIYAELHDGLIAIAGSLVLAASPIFLALAVVFFLLSQGIKIGNETRNVFIIFFIMSLVIIGMLSYMSNKNNIEDYINYKINESVYREKTAKNYEFIFYISSLLFWLIFLYALWYVIKFFSAQAQTR